MTYISNKKIIKFEYGQSLTEIPTLKFHQSHNLINLPIFTNNIFTHGIYYNFHDNSSDIKEYFTLFKNGGKYYKCWYSNTKEYKTNK